MVILIIIVAWVVWYIERMHDRANGSPDDLISDNCLNCGTPVAPRDERCAKCGQLTRFGRRKRLQSHWPAEPAPVRTPVEDEQWSRLITADSELEATLLQQQLEARGVPSRIESKSKSYLLAGSYTPIHEVQELHVPQHEFERSTEIMRELVEAGVSASAK